MAASLSKKKAYLLSGEMVDAIRKLLKKTPGQPTLQRLKRRRPLSSIAASGPLFFSVALTNLPERLLHAITLC